MKTNVEPKTIVKAVKNVSAAKYNNNVIFRRYPEFMTKNVVRFTVKTKDANKPGSMVMKDGKKLPKANSEVHKHIMEEIFKLDAKPNVYVDLIEEGNTHRVYNPNPSESTVKVTETAPERLKRKYNKRAGQLLSTGKKGVNQLMNALNYVLKHPELMNT